MPTQTPVARAGFLRDQLSSSPCRTELFPTYNTLNATNYGHRTCPRPQEQGEPTSYDLKCRSKLLETAYVRVSMPHTVADQRIPPYRALALALPPVSQPDTVRTRRAITSSLLAFALRRRHWLTCLVLTGGDWCSACFRMLHEYQSRRCIFYAIFS
ncbi:hypothetical protein Bpfe_030876 [Biomphalaria pfeifferi]|uniref:Uncharacterized protein n=1 Tax=Biomphalaria pfeifferi TaxID=112525 RepID=A0AAD8ANU5_BIOPF|nr:hypothetical protein Bpfe_030876 [Biomphalaria pfeifferi]